MFIFFLFFFFLLNCEYTAGETVTATSTSGVCPDLCISGGQFHHHYLCNINANIKTMKKANKIQVLF